MSTAGHGLRQHDTRGHSPGLRLTLILDFLKIKYHIQELTTLRDEEMSSARLTMARANVVRELLDDDFGSIDRVTQAVNGNASAI